MNNFPRDVKHRPVGSNSKVEGGGGLFHLKKFLTSKKEKGKE
jgi:hypothetical protein